MSEAPSQPLVHVIDDDESVRESLAFLLETADFQVKAYDSAESFLDRLSEVAPGCIISDIRMPGMSGLDLIRHLNERGFPLPVIMITGHGDVPLAVEAMRAGVVDFIEKPFSDGAILASVKLALDRGRDQIAFAAERSAVAQRIDSLSMRERQVLNGLVAGQSNKVVAIELGISPRTVEVYRANLMTKMRASSLSELVRMTLLVEQRG